jgi:alpha-glucoside transport system permease protein
MGDILYGLVAVLLGVAGSYLLFWLLNALRNLLPEKIAEKFNVFAFLTPAAFLLLIVLVYPFVQTINWSFRANSRFQEWVGFENYVEMLGDASFYSILLNNFLWVMFVPAITVFFGTMVATLSNNVGPRREKVFKSLIFMPMSISLIAASTIWSYMYVYSPPGRPVIGFFNAVAEGAGFESQPWLTISTFHLNSFMLMAVVVWLQTGYAMVIISAAIKAVPEETLEAARIDGANAYQIFMRVILPQVWGTVMAVFITTLIMVMKIFDVVLAMTGGNFDTKVLAYEWYIQFFEAGKLGNASAIVMVLTVLITPLMWLQIRTVRQQEMLR